MCGIWSIFSDEYISKETVINNLSKFDSIKNRGPDKTVIRRSRKSVQGFQRLGIILGIVDESYISDQPFQIVTKDINDRPITMTMVCNGEIFNYKELIEEHMLNELYTDSDCEIILRLYDKYKNIEIVLNLLRGEFAFIIDIEYHDENKSVRILARDQFGVRPLFYNIVNNLLFVGSTLESVGYPGKEFTPACYAIINSVHDVQFTEYYKYNIPIIEEYNFNVLFKNITDLLIQAVKRRTITDRELGVTLSGGLDSSLVAGIIVKILNVKDLQTFSTGLFGSVDLHYAGIVARYLGTRHRESPATVEHALTFFRKIIHILGSYDVTSIRASIWQLMVAIDVSVNSNVKVILNGDGADEVMMGYKENEFAPTPLIAHENRISRTKNIHKYDGRRMDRCISSQGLEARPSFLDVDFVNYMFSIPPQLMIPIKGLRMEKKLIRQAFQTLYPDVLPEEIINRPKEAFSDGVSEKDSEISWFQIITDYMETQVSDEEYKNRDIMFESCVSKEAYYYKKIYYEIYGDNFDVVGEPWLPNWIDTGGEPSARVLPV